MTNRRIVIPLVLLLFPVLLPAQLSHNETIALEYARQSLSLLQDGLTDEAFLLAGRGLGFDEASSDLHYLRAVSGAERKEQTLSARSHLESAIALDNWRLIDEQNGVRSLLSILLRIGESEAARALLPELRLRQPVDYRIIAQVLRLAGEFSEADDVFSRGRRLYPGDVGLYRFGLSLDTVPEPAERRWLDRHASDSQDYLAALLDFILITSSVTERRELLERYFDAGGDHPMAYAAAVEGDPERFIDAAAYRDRSALRLAARTVAGTPEEENLRDALRGFSGTIVEDTNRDSFSEGRMEIRDGSLELWEIDRNTDGVAEWRLHFESGVPVREDRTVGDARYQLSFYDYPEVATVTFLSLPGQPTYHLLPGAIDSVIVPPEEVRGADTLDLVTSLRLADTPRLLSPAVVAPSAYVVDFYDDTGDQNARVVVDGSFPVRRFEDSTGDGRIDRVLDYEEGVVVAGVRDPDGDGYFEVTEQYIAGELALLLVDEDDDFTVEYTEAPGSTLLDTPAIYSWDLDGDGLVDIQEIIQQQNLLLGDFFSSAPGVFDVTFEEVLRVFTP
jgi:tetratricopeptide (TPR) repeat protein